MIAAGVVFHDKYTVCASVVWDLTDKKQLCRKTTEIPGPTHPKPDASMLLALENKR